MDKNNMILPLGVTFKFSVMPSIRTYQQQGLKNYIIENSGLKQYFNNVEVSFYDGCYTDKDGLSKTDDSLKEKQMQIKVFCPEATVAIDKRYAEDFYKQVKEKFSGWIINAIQNNDEITYSAKLEDFLFVQRWL
jgi:hypothetical protein